MSIQPQRHWNQCTNATNTKQWYAMPMNYQDCVLNIIGHSVAGRNAQSISPKYTRWQGMDLTKVQNNLKNTHLSRHNPSCQRSSRHSSAEGKWPTSSLPCNDSVSIATNSNKQFDPNDLIEVENSTEHLSQLPKHKHERSFERLLNMDDLPSTNTLTSLAGSVKSISQAIRKPSASTYTIDKINISDAQDLPSTEDATTRKSHSEHTQKGNQQTAYNPLAMVTSTSMQTPSKLPLDIKESMVSWPKQSSLNSHPQDSSQAVIPISIREYNALHMGITNFRKEISFLQAKISDEMNLKERIGYLETQLEVHARGLATAKQLFRSGSSILSQQGRQAMDLSYRLHRGDNISSEAVADAYVNATQLLNEAETFQIVAHQWIKDVSETEAGIDSTTNTNMDYRSTVVADPTLDSNAAGTAFRAGPCDSSSNQLPKQSSHYHDDEQQYEDYC